MKTIGNMKLNKWTLMYIAGIPMGIVLSQFQGKGHGTRIFVMYLSLFMLLHAAIPFVSIVEKPTRIGKIQSWFFKITFPAISFLAWIILGMVAVKVGLD